MVLGHEDFEPGLVDRIKVQMVSSRRVDLLAFENKKGGFDSTPYTGSTVCPEVPKSITSNIYVVSVDFTELIFLYIPLVWRNNKRQNIFRRVFPVEPVVCFFQDWIAHV